MAGSTAHDGIKAHRITEARSVPLLVLPYHRDRLRGRDVVARHPIHVGHDPNFGMGSRHIS